jgi:ParB-like chromosome segregation protein Spo0J
MTGSQITKLAKEMRANGFDKTKPISVQRTANGKMMIIDGHHRTAAAIRAGIERVPVEIYDS